MMNRLFVTCQVAELLRLVVTLVAQVQVAMIADLVGLQRLCRGSVIFTFITAKVHLVVSHQLVAFQI